METLKDATTQRVRQQKEADAHGSLGGLADNPTGHRDCFSLSEKIPPSESTFRTVQKISGENPHWHARGVTGPLEKMQSRYKSGGYSSTKPTISNISYPLPIFPSPANYEENIQEIFPTRSKSSFPFRSFYEESFSELFPTANDLILTDGDVTEGDILDLDLDALVSASAPAGPDVGKISRGRSRRKRNAVAFGFFRWPNGVIPFTLDEAYNKTERTHILQAMNEFHGKTCLHFVPREQQADYLSVIKFRGCASKIGRQGGRQPLFLNQECIDPKRPGIVMHELMHSLGFLHEQTRHDRDDYIDVLWNNIAPDHQDNFAKVDKRLVSIYDAPYDYGSVMHYGPNFFAVNYTNPTIVPKKPTKVLGQRVRLSDADAEKINKLYNCYRNDEGKANSDSLTAQINSQWSDVLRRLSASV